MTITTDALKLCRRCAAIKLVEEFSACKKSRDGLQSWCRQCRVGYAAAWWASHPEQAAERKNAKSARQRQRYAEDGRHRADRKEKVAAWRRKRPDKMEQYRERNSETHKTRYATDLEFRQKYLTRDRERQLLRRLERYGLSLEQYLQMAQAQDGKCLLCGRKPKRALNVDHDHRTGAIRGLLCTACNTGLGKLGDDKAGLQRAMDYLDRAEKAAPSHPLRA